jgi:hypothetical protein
LLRRIFNAYGESDFAEDDVLLEEMIEAAASGGDGDGDVLDLASFASALTYDITEYNTKNETFCTTNFDDVMLTQRGYEIEKGQDADLMSRELSLADVESRKSKATVLWKVFTAPAIDSTAGTQRTKSLSTILWVTGKTQALYAASATIVSRSILTETGSGLLSPSYHYLLCLLLPISKSLW